MKKIFNNRQIEQYIEQKIAKNTCLFIMRFLFFVFVLFFLIYFIFSYFPLYEFAQECLPIFPMLAKFIMFLCSQIGKTIVVIDSIIGFFLIILFKFKQIE